MRLRLNWLAILPFVALMMTGCDNDDDVTPNTVDVLAADGRFHDTRSCT